MATPVQMPRPGNTVEECLITEWLVDEGAEVAEGQTLCSIETDKASFEVEAPAAGTLLQRFFDDGDLVPVLTHIAAIGEAGEDVSDLAPDAGGAEAPAAAEPPRSTRPAAAEAPSPAAETEPPSPRAAAGTAAATSGTERVSPRARRLAAEKEVDLQALSGSGPHGRILSEDVAAAADLEEQLTPLARDLASATGQVPGRATGLGGRVRAADLVEPDRAAAAAEAPAGRAAPAAVETVPYRGIRKLIGDRMRESLQRHAQLTLNASADATAILAYRRRVKAEGERLGLPNITLNDLICHVVAQTLPAFPALNAVFDQERAEVRRFGAVHLGLAVDTERGLMVPVVRGAESLSLAELSRAVAELAGQCRQGSIDPERLEGGTFTVTNLGTLGVESFTPVLNSPQVAILGVCSIEEKPVRGPDDGLLWQPTLGLSLTIDHQVVDGAPAARFLQAVAAGIADVELLLAR
jgi:pyruvate dehydrogenase E2 component (dihydrolipoamide acetyltransferase)